MGNKSSEFRDILDAILTGTAGGLSESMKQETELRKEIFKEQLKRRINPEDIQLKQAQIEATRSLGKQRESMATMGMPVITGYDEGGEPIMSFMPKGTREILSPQEKARQKAEGKAIVNPMIEKISKGEDAYYTLGDVTIQLQGEGDRFSKFMGPGKGILRNPLRSYVNKDLQDFLGWQANVQDAFQQYRVAITGAQASDKEIRLLAKNRPTENDTYDVFLKKAQNVRKIGNRVISRYISNLRKAGYNTTGYEETLERLQSEFSELGGDKTLIPKSESMTEGITKSGIKYKIVR